MNRKTISRSKQRPHIFFMARLFLLACTILCFSHTMQAQQRVITGTVTAGADNEAIPGANILIEGTLEGTITDISGNFSLEINSETDTLVVSYLGYLSERVAVSGKQTLNIVLIEDIQQLSEVVVIGYGTRQKVNLIGAVDKIDGNFLENRPVGNAMQALQGASANLIIQQRSMNPNDNSMNINIRGISTMTNNDPLIVIDGIITEIGSLNQINPSDIDNISILKDAGSAAIYGSRSSNGVILVTTKKGKLNSKPVVRFNALTGIQSPDVLFRPVKGYENALLKNQALINGGASPIYSPDFIQGLYDHQDEEKWFLDEILQNGVQQNYSISMSGGTENSSYMVSGGYYNQESNFVGDYGIERYNFRTNLVNDYGKLKLSALMSYNRTLQHAPNASTGILIIDASRLPAYPHYKMKGENGNYLLNDVLTQFNSLGLLEAGGFQDHDNDNFLSSLNAEFEIIRGLTAKAIAGFDLGANHRYIRAIEVPFYPGEDALEPTQRANSNRNTEDYNEKRYILNTQFLLDYNKTFKSVHNVSGLIGVSNESYTRKANEIRKRFTDVDLGLPETETIIDDGSYNTPAQTQERSIYSVFGRAGYVYADKYYGEFSFRYDGSSKFAKDYRWGFFPSFTAGWRISQEDFMGYYKDNIGDLKIRGSYGVLGNQSVDDYSYITTYTVYTNTYGFNNQSVSGTGFDFGNKELLWEESANTNIGFDATFFRSRLNVSFDFFNKKTSGILLKPVVPTVFGGDVSFENAGIMQNRGWETTIGYQGNTGPVKHNVNFNFADSKNKVIDFGGEERILASDQMRKIIREGEAFSSYYGYQTDGIYKNYEEIENSALPLGAIVQPGDVRYVDATEDGVINDEDRVVLGNAFPRYTFGLSYRVTWKGIDLSALVQGVGKRSMFLRGELVEPFHSNYSYVIYQHQLDYWSPTNTDAQWPRLASPGSASNNHNYGKESDIYLFNAAYIRLKDIQLGYTIPRSVSSRVGIQKLRINLSAQNLLTLSKIPFIDPESTEFGNNMGGTGGVGANSGRNYPTLKFYGIGLDIEF